jgi:hypothetical protein
MPENVGISTRGAGEVFHASNAAAAITSGLVAAPGRYSVGDIIACMSIAAG